MTVSVVIPAHNEEAVIERCVRGVLRNATPGEFRVVVVANGCADRTAEVARGVDSSVEVIETPVGCKTSALNLGDDAVGDAFPRIYLDGDLSLSTDAARMICAALREPGVLAAAPRFEFDLDGASWAVRAFYRAWATMPYFDTGRIAGAYALSREGRARFGRFPKLISDDGFVRLHFAPHERKTVEGCSVTVVAPRTLGDLLKIKTRSKAGTMELRAKHPALFANETASEGASLKRLLSRPLLWPSYAVYVAVNLVAKRRAARRLSEGSKVWERDESSRVASGKDHAVGV
ncbi:MAG: glycosyltransferase family 2 protein [Phycisphaeraceae bacterium]|nr:glycosyltransferase family 2 protein [Phycisphaeraceae bacterium]